MIKVKIDIDEDYIKKTGNIDCITQTFEDISNAVKNCSGSKGWINSKEGACIGRWEINWWTNKQI